jgi:hypothetical protein
VVWELALYDDWVGVWAPTPDPTQERASRTPDPQHPLPLLQTHTSLTLCSSSFIHSYIHSISLSLSLSLTMLTVTPRYVQLLQTAGNTLYNQRDSLLRPVPLHASDYTLVGRLCGGLHKIVDSKALIEQIRIAHVRTAMKKAEANPHSDVDTIAVQAENPPWLQSIGDATIRYVCMEDLLHPNGVSRFHLMVKKEASEQGSRYFIKDLGSLNGIYLEGFKVKPHLWYLMREGTLVRFAPQTKNCKNYFNAFQQADEANARIKAQLPPGTPFQPVTCILPPQVLSVKDMHVEYVFTHTPSQAAIDRAANAHLEETTPIDTAKDEREDRPIAASYSVAKQEPRLLKDPATVEVATAAAVLVEVKNNDESSSSSSTKRKAEFGLELAETLTCGVCLDVIIKCAVLNCDHAFCRNCIEEWFTVNNYRQTCPTCRKVHRGQPHGVIAIDHTVQHLLDTPLKQAWYQGMVAFSTVQIAERARRRAEAQAAEAKANPNPISMPQ